MKNRFGNPSEIIDARVQAHRNLARRSRMFKKARDLGHKPLRSAFGRCNDCLCALETCVKSECGGVQKAADKIAKLVPVITAPVKRKVGRPTVKAKYMTEAQVKAVQCVHDHPGVTPAKFAKLMWPNAEGWKKKCTTGGGVGHGTHMVKGGAMNITAGALLGKLASLGWIERRKHKTEPKGIQAYITATGVTALNNATEFYKSIGR